MEKRYRYVYVLRSRKDRVFYAGFTEDLSTRFEAHNKRRSPRSEDEFQLSWSMGRLPQPSRCNSEGELSQEHMGQTLDQEQAPELSHWLREILTTMITHVLNKPEIGVKSPLD
jgi:hypothetical protein